MYQDKSIYYLDSTLSRGKEFDDAFYIKLLKNCGNIVKL